jgi:predicted ArsR family transcriptional regulator
MPNSRQKILDYILEQQSTTVEELSKVFRVTPANIRHHLSILNQQGSIKVIGQKSAVVKGRPAQIFSSSQQSDLNNLDNLSDALLCRLISNSGINERDQLIKNIASHLGAEFKTDFSNPTRRLYSTIHSLNRMNYQAHWEAHIMNPRVMLGHCPYRRILDDHPELCQLDASLLEYFMDISVRQIEKLDINAKGLPQCVFLINLPA